VAGAVPVLRAGLDESDRMVALRARVRARQAPLVSLCPVEFPPL
jgi:hypothetical protein